MNENAPMRPRSCGFRFSALDLAALLICVPATAAAWRFIGAASLVLPIALGHFFLFCNVFRIHRRWELIWAGAFILNVAAWSLSEGLNWIAVLIVQSPLTAGLIACEMRKPRYHGIGATKINRRIDEWLSGAID